MAMRTTADRRLSYIRERRNLLVGRRLDVVDRHAAIGFTGVVVRGLRYLQNGKYKGGANDASTCAEVASIRVLEIHDCGPIVRKVFLKSAGRARRDLGEIEAWIHRKVEPERHEMQINLYMRARISSGNHTRSVGQSFSHVG